LRISHLRNKLIIQKNTITTDSYGNHIDVWADSFSVHASILNQSVSEDEIAGQTVISDNIDFEVRYSSKTASLTSKDSRIVFNGNIYGIDGIDLNCMTKKSLRLKCKRVRR